MSAIKFGESLSKFMIPIALLEKLSRFYGIPTSPLGSVVLHYECNITHMTHNNKEYEVCIYYNPPPIKFVTLINKIKRNKNTALKRSVINYWRT